MKTKTLENTLELWDEINSTADFKSSDYDESLLNVLTAELNFDQSHDIRAQLAEHNTPPEQLLAALLKAMEPFSIMLRDLLTMFEEANAQYTDNNIQIEFHFKNAEKDFHLDLSHFRVYKEETEKVVQTCLQIERCSPWKDLCDPLWKILNSQHLPLPCNRPRFSDDIEEWLQAYAKNDDSCNWPEYFPAPPRCGTEGIDKVVKELWLFPKAANDLYRKCYRADQGRKRSLWAMHESGDADERFYQDETDRWVGWFVEQLCRIVSVIYNMNHALNDCSAVIEELGGKLKAFRDKLPVVSVESERWTRKLIELLNLPEWKQRYALYSAWVATQIVSAFDKEAVRYNVPNGVLSFSFGGSEIARIRQMSVEYVLYAELRTPFAMKGRRGRSKHIQPDYSLCFGDASDPKNTVLVVECKQYKHPSKKNFTNAVLDYAKGRPKAKVILANYSRIPNTIQEALSSEIADRVPYFDMLFPGGTPCDPFQEAVRSSLLRECRVTLSWGKAPDDMDLSLEITDLKQNKTEVSCFRAGSMERFPWAVLDQDARKARGSKTIQVVVDPSLKYEFFVRNYSGEKTEGRISVRVQYGENTWITIDCGAELNKTNVWNAFTIDKASAYVVDKVNPDPLHTKALYKLIGK